MAEHERAYARRPHVKYLAVCGAIGVVFVVLGAILDFGFTPDYTGQLPQVPGMPSPPNVPTRGLPSGLPRPPSLPSLPNLPSRPSLPGLPSLPGGYGPTTTEPGAR